MISRKSQIQGIVHDGTNPKLSSLGNHNILGKLKSPKTIQVDHIQKLDLKYMQLLQNAGYKYHF